jgi:hypothetical protein
MQAVSLPAARVIVDGLEGDAAGAGSRQRWRRRRGCGRGFRPRCGRRHDGCGHGCRCGCGAASCRRGGRSHGAPRRFRISGSVLAAGGVAGWADPVDESVSGRWPAERPAAATTATACRHPGGRDGAGQNGGGHRADAGATAALQDAAPGAGGRQSWRGRWRCSTPARAEPDCHTPVDPAAVEV